MLLRRKILLVLHMLAHLQLPMLAPVQIVTLHYLHTVTAGRVDTTIIYTF